MAYVTSSFVLDAIKDCNFIDTLYICIYREREKERERDRERQRERQTERVRQTDRQTDR